MILQVFSIRDRAVDAFMTPFFHTHVGGAMRLFTDEINNPQSQTGIGKHPVDYDLYHLGSYDDSSGKFVLLDAPRQVAIGKDLKQQAAS